MKIGIAKALLKEIYENEDTHITQRGLSAIKMLVNNVIEYEPEISRLQEEKKLLYKELKDLEKAKCEGYDRLQVRVEELTELYEKASDVCDSRSVRENEYIAEWYRLHKVLSEKDKDILRWKECYEESERNYQTLLNDTAGR